MVNCDSNMIDYVLLLKDIENDVYTAKTHLSNHVTTEGKILNLDKHCEYCQIYFKQEEGL
jgi:hypothetical protein